MARGFTSNTFVSKTNRGLAGFTAMLVLAFGIAMAFNAFGPRGYAIVAVGVAWLLLTIWCFLWRPSLSVDDDAVRIVNPLRSIEIPWASVAYIDTKYTLTVFTEFGRFAVACAPQPGQLAARRAVKRAEKEPNSHVALDSGIRIGDLPGTESGDAAALVRDRWESWKLQPGSADAEATAPVKRLHAASVAAMLLLPTSVVLLAVL